MGLDIAKVAQQLVSQGTPAAAIDQTAKVLNHNPEAAALAMNRDVWAGGIPLQSQSASRFDMHTVVKEFENAASASGAADRVMIRQTNSGILYQRAEARLARTNDPAADNSLFRRVMANIGLAETSAI